MIVTQTWNHWHTVWICVALLAPVAAAVVVVLAKVRRSRSWRWSLAEVGMVYGTLPWVWMIFTPVNTPPGATTVYLVPFSDLRDQLDVVQIGGNLLVLFTFGAFAPIRFARLANLTRLALLGLAVALTFELLQHAWVRGRVFSVDDVWLNALGCVLGGLVTRRHWRASGSS